MKNGRYGERHEEDSTQNAAECHHLSRDASWHHISVSYRGHGDHGPPVTPGDTCELLLGAQLALS